MDIAGYLVTAVLVEGRSPREVARAHGVSKTWVYELLARYRAEGEAGLVPRSKRPRRSPTKVAHRFEEEIIRLRQQLTEQGFDAGGRDHSRPSHPPPPPELGPLELHHLAGAQGPGLRRPRTAQAPQELLRALPGQTPERVLADGRDPLDTQRWP